ncbi:hypothetical protein ABPG75_005953 [Micractinium tetrahymenae]
MEPLRGEAVCSSVLGRSTLRLRVACREVADLAPARPPDPLCVLLALDRSGSMYGRPLDAAKRAACAFAQHAAAAAAELGLAGLELLCFDWEVEAIDLFGLSASRIERKVDRVEDGGGTCFSSVLSAIQARVLAAPAARHFVVFLTDGEDNGHVPADEALAAFQAATGAAQLAVHSLGFGKHLDAAFLATITLAGSTQGSFQYLRRWCHPQAAWLMRGAGGLPGLRASCACAPRCCWGLARLAVSRQHPARWSWKLHRKRGRLGRGARRPRGPPAPAAALLRPPRPAAAPCASSAAALCSTRLPTCRRARRAGPWRSTSPGGPARTAAPPRCA